MAAGGIYDQIGGGFARYSVDAIWLVPHFEKMLYDNALLARVYLHGYQVLGQRALARDLRAHARLGATRDARRRGRLLLGARRRLRGRGGQVLRLDAGRDPRGARSRGPRRARRGCDRLLRRHRAGQLRGPGTSSTCPAAPGAIAPGAPRRGPARRSTRRAEAGLAGPRRQAPRRLERADDRAPSPRPAPSSVATTTSTPRAAPPTSCSAEMRDGDGRLLRTWKNGEAKLNAYLEDHAFLLEALLTLYEATFEVRWFDAARETADSMIERFARSRARRLLHDLERPRAADRATQGHRRPPDPVRQLRRRLRPAAARGAHRRARATRRKPNRSSGSSAGSPPTTRRRSPTSCGRSTSTSRRSRRSRSSAGGGRSARRPRGDGAGPLSPPRRPRRRRRGRPSAPSCCAGATAIDGRAAAYVCENFACQRPVTEPDELERLLGTG